MIHPAIIVWWIYPLAALAVLVWASRRDLLAPAAVVWVIWLLGIAYQLHFKAETPLAYYLLADGLAFLWLIWLRDRCASIFAGTFAVQIVLHVTQVAVPMSAMTYWVLHTGTAFAQLAVLIWWARCRQRESSAPLPARP